MNTLDLVTVPEGDCRPLLPAWDAKYPFLAYCWLPGGEVFCVQWQMYYAQSDFIFHEHGVQ